MISIITPSIRPQYLDITQRTLEAQTFKDFEWLVDVGLHTEGFTLPKAFNRLIRAAKGDTIVILQDCISIPEDALERISHLPLEKKAYTFPVVIEGRKDWRSHSFGVRQLTPNQWEIDFAVAPRDMFYDVGGFDEAFCDGWGWDNVELGWRAGAAGYDFLSSDATHGDAIDHDKLIEHPFRNKLKNNDWRAEETRWKAAHGDYKLNFL